MRIEKDGLGEKEIPDNAYYGIHTQRAIENFPISGYRLHPEFIKAFAQVKKACALVNTELGYMEEKIGKAIVQACNDLINGELHTQIKVDPLQGGAGTSTNMNFNEVIANRAIEILGGEKGNYEIVHPLHQVNMHQSTNDVYPTALKIATLNLLKRLEEEVAKLQEAFQIKEQEFKNVVKLGRTELQDAVPITLGMEFGAYAEAIARDRWRIFKARERIKIINLGGTAVGTGLGAPRKYIFKVTEKLRELTGLNIARAENLVDATQNMDIFVEVSGMLKAYAANLFKIAGDLRLLGSGPHGGIAEIKIPPVQPGSSIMPGKVNPVILEAVQQVALKVIGNDNVITLVASLGQLELNQFIPLSAHSLLESLEILINTTKILRTKCVEFIEPDSEKCLEYVIKSKTIATVLVPILGYKKVEEIVKKAMKQRKSIKEILIEDRIMTNEQVEKLLLAKRMYKLGFTEDEYDEFKRN